ncbi:MAG TPA: hypothetical protein VEU30_03665, partial [Thermoanaerobaculia bacterium]|nr:hypothetical protein [Thermoanaerobaculia bacterium]
LFHSERERSLTENFFRETDDDRHLRSAFFARHGQAVNGRYWGVDHEMYIAPIPNSPWAVVAMRDESVLRAVNNEIIATTTLLLALLALLYAFGFVLLAVLKPKYRAPWLWPHEDLHRDYLAAIVALLMEVAAFMVCILVLAPDALLFIGFVAPVRGIVTAYLMMNTVNGRPRSLIRDGHGRYWLIGVVVAIVLSVIWLFAIAFGSVEPAFIRWWMPPWLYKLQLIAYVAATLVLTTRQFHALADGGALLESAGSAIVARIRGLARSIIDPGDCRTIPRSKLPPLMPYALTGFLMLIVAAALPALGFLKVASRLGVEARVKWSQLELAAMLERRLNLLERKNIRHARIAYDCFAVPNVFGSVWTVDPRTSAARPALYVPGQPARNPAATVPIQCEPGTRDASAWVPNYLHSLLPRYSETSVAMRELHHDQTSDASWVWCRDASILTLKKPVTLQASTTARLYTADGSTGRPPSRQQLVIQSVVPHLFALTPSPAQPETSCDPPLTTPDRVTEESAAAGYAPVKPPTRKLAILWFFIRPGQVPWFLFRGFVYATVIGLGVYVLISAVGFMGRRVFLADVAPAAWLPRDERLKPGVRAHLFIHHAAEVSDLVVPRSFATFSIGDVDGRAHAWSRLARAIDAVGSAEVLIIDFEKGMDDPFFSGGKLAFVEELLAARRHTLVVMSRAAATTILANGRSRERWSRVFDAFIRIDESLLLHTSPAREHDHGRGPCGPYHSSDQLPDRMLQRSWDECSRMEKLVLHQVAVHGLANGKASGAVESLLSRHFICRTPALRICCRPFHNFVLAAGEQEHLDEIESAAAATPWERLRLPMAFLAIVTLSLVVSTQQDLINATSAIITGLAAGLPALIKLVAVLTGRKATELDGD